MFKKLSILIIASIALPIMAAENVVTKAKKSPWGLNGSIDSSTPMDLSEQEMTLDTTTRFELSYKSSKKRKISTRQYVSYTFFQEEENRPNWSAASIRYSRLLKKATKEDRGFSVTFEGLFYPQREQVESSGINGYTRMILGTNKEATGKLSFWNGLEVKVYNIQNEEKAKGTKYLQRIYTSQSYKINDKTSITADQYWSHKRGNDEKKDSMDLVISSSHKFKKFELSPYIETNLIKSGDDRLISENWAKEARFGISVSKKIF